MTAQTVHDLVSLAVIPTGQVLTTLGEPSQFIAVGTFNTTPNTVDLTDQVTWESSDVKVAAINSSGLALGNNLGTTTITTMGKSKSGAAITGIATLTENASGGGVVLPALTVYTVGLGTGRELCSGHNSYYDGDTGSWIDIWGLVSKLYDANPRLMFRRIEQQHASRRDI